jgi:hypothetical protein
LDRQHIQGEVRVYEVFDSFLATSTWYTGHDRDLERFNQALGLVVEEFAFNADEMGAYMKGKVNPVHHDYVDELVAKGWAVREYLKATG